MVMRIARGLMTLALVLAVATCNKKSPTAPSAYTQTVPGTVSSFGVTEHTITIPRDGNLTLALTWQAIADLDFYLTASTCTDIYGATPCPFLASSDASTGQSETITRPVTKNETFKAWVDNFGLTPVNYSIQVRIE